MHQYNYIGALLGDWSLNASHLGAIALRIGLVLVMSSIIGRERATKRHPAGLRTFILSGITAVFAALCDEFILATTNARVTLLSAAYLMSLATVSGKSLLFTSRNQLKELTTSIALFTNAMLSLCVGHGMYTCAVIGFAVMIVCIAFFPALEKGMKGRSPQFEIHLELKSRNMLLEFISAIREFGLHLDEIEINPAYATTGLGVYTVKVTIEKDKLLKSTHNEILDALSALNCVSYIEELN